MEDMKSPTVGILSLVLNKSIHITCYKVKKQCVSAAVLQQTLNQTILREAGAHKISPTTPSSSTVLFSMHILENILLFHASCCWRNTFSASENIYILYTFPYHLSLPILEKCSKPVGARIFQSSYLIYIYF